MKSIPADKSNGRAKAEQESLDTKSVGARQRRDIKMEQNVLLIWLNNKIDNNNEDCRHTVVRLRRIINGINTFTDGDQCIRFINTITDTKICMIISGSLGQHIVPQVHNMSQIDSIFIFCGNKKHHEQWTKGWIKIKGVFTEITPLCEALKQTSQQCERNSISISFVSTSGDASSENLDRLDSMFMYTQIMKEILLSITFEQQHFQEFIDYCREQLTENDHELNNINKFERQYHDKTPIWWYTYECFLHPTLNCALRKINADIIIKMGFFLSDLHREIETLHKAQFVDDHTATTFTVYRGQGLSKTDFEEMTKTRGGLISFNNFLSTSKDRGVSLAFAESNENNPDLIGILFVMTIDPSKSTTPFASIRDISYFQKEDEVLFSMHTVFRIHDIQPMSESHRLFLVDLTLTNENDKDLNVLTRSIREEVDPNSKEWHKLGKLLLKLGQPDKVQQVYEILLNQTSDDIEKAFCYHYIGLAKNDKGEYKEARSLYEQTLKIRQQSLPLNHPDLADSYHSIGDTYYEMSEYSKALSNYEKGLEIRQLSLPSNHPGLANSYSSIGAVYGNTGEYSKALSSLEKALEIRQQSLPSNHPSLAKTYTNVGAVYYDMGEYSKALSSHEKALEIWQKSLPPNHPSLARSYNNIGTVYDNMGQYSQALSSHEKALEIQQQSLPPNHPSLAFSCNRIGVVYKNMGEYSKAITFSEKALEIQQQSLPSNHPSLASSYNNIGLVHENMGEYPQARLFCERAVNIAQQLLPSNHPYLQTYRNDLDRIKQKL